MRRRRGSNAHQREREIERESGGVVVLVVEREGGEEKGRRWARVLKQMQLFESQKIKNNKT